MRVVRCIGATIVALYVHSACTYNAFTTLYCHQSLPGKAQQSVAADGTAQGVYQHKVVNRMSDFTTVCVKDFVTDSVHACVLMRHCILEHACKFLHGDYTWPCMHLLAESPSIRGNMISRKDCCISGIPD